MADIDYDALATQYGGADAPKAAAVDYDALAKRFGAQEAPKTHSERADAAIQRGAIGVGETLGSLVTGAVAAPVAGIVGLAQGAKNLVSPGGMSAADRVQQVQGAMTYEPKTEAGQAVSGVVNYLPEKLAEGADVAGEAVSRGVDKVLPGAGPAVGAAVNTGIQALPMIAGKFGAPVARRTLALAQEKADVLNKVNAPQAADLLAARERNLTISPAEANPTILNRMLEGASGQAKVQQLASSQNQPIVQNIVRKGLGIRDDVPVTREALESVRKEAGKTYEKVRNVGEIPIDEKYTAALDKIESDYKGAAKSFSEEVDPVQKAVDSARNTVKEGVFDSDAAVSKIKLERKRADKAFRQGDAELGKAHKAIADAIEEQIERKLAPGGTSAVGGQANLLAEFQKSRALIARSYDVQKALTKTGEIDARVLAEQLRKGRPLGEDLMPVAKIAGRYPGSFQAGGKNAYTNVNAFDALMGLGAAGSALAHAPGAAPAVLAGAAAAAARPAIRAGILSAPYQRAFAGPRHAGPGAIPTLADMSTRDPALLAGAELQAHGFQTLEDELRR